MHFLYRTESLTAIVDCFRVAMQNCGNDRAKFTNGGQMKRRKSRTHALDIPIGMQRNLSESHLAQAGSAVRNVAEQFSKLGHSLNPKILTGKKPTSAGGSSNSSVADSGSNAALVSEEKASKYTIKVMHGENLCDNGEDSLTNSAGISETTSKFNNNSFLQSVGIVMVDAAEMAETQNQTETRKSANKNKLENVARISISSVTDNVKLPPEMLDISDIPDKSIATPEINVEFESDDGKNERNNGMKMCHSVADMRDSASAFDEDGSR